MEYVIKAVKIEFQVLNIELTNNLTSPFCIDTKSCMIADGIPAACANTAVGTLINPHHKHILKHSFATLVIFCEVYKAKATIIVIPQPIPTTHKCYHISSSQDDKPGNKHFV
jgi:hypothetical protein